MKLIVGLGNPGEKYGSHRHNVGFRAIDALADAGGLGPFRRRFNAQIVEGSSGRHRFLLMKPQTFMNESGRSVGEAMRFYKLKPADVIVIHDELDLAPGRFKLKTGGGAAGHNGLKSIVGHIGGEFARLRIGIGHPGDRALVSGYVLHDFAKADKVWLEDLLAALPSALAALLDGDDARVMNSLARATKTVPVAPQSTARSAAASSVRDQQTAAAVSEPALAAASSPKTQPSAATQPQLAGEHIGAKLARWFGKRR